MANTAKILQTIHELTAALPVIASTQTVNEAKRE